MHDEDNKYGLRVTNLRGDKWIAYGDGMLLEEKSKDNLKVAAEAVQKSVDQVYEAYTNPSGSLDPSQVTDLIPFVDQEERNNSPMFQMIDGKLPQSTTKTHTNCQIRPISLNLTSTCMNWN